MALHMAGASCPLGGSSGLWLRAQGLSCGSLHALLGLPHSMEVSFQESEVGGCASHFDDLALESQSITFPVLFTCTY